ncbi:MAG: leucine-rich repeat protein [Bacteroidetes bacterium]|nr:leucine-rich repeat protein [Bacteroidota bacterium]
MNAQVSGITYPFSAIINSPITILGNNAFSGVNTTNGNYLVSVNAPNVITIRMAVFTNCSSLESATFPLAETIGNSAFYECSSLESVEFPFVKTIDNSAFRICSSLVSVEFPFVETIGNSAFEICISLENVDFPKAESIGNSAFDNCRQLNSIKLGALPPTLGTNVFNNVTLSKVTLRIPEGSLCAYQDDSDWGAAFLAQFDAVEEYSVATPVTYYTLAVNVSGNGSATSGATGITCGNTKTLTATPDAFHQFVNWTSDNGFSSTANPLDIVVKSDTNIVAHFIMISSVHTLTLDDDGNGSASVSGGSTTGITFGDSRTITATPNACYQFAKWTNSNGDSISNVSSLNISVIRDTLLKANFIPISPAPTYTLSVNSNNTTMGTASSLVSSATCGSIVSVTATPNAGYKFVGWQEGLYLVSTADTYTFNITANTSLTAVFDDVKKKTRIKKINVKKGRVRIKPQP